jgi:hypothetical protein
MYTVGDSEVANGCRNQATERKAETKRRLDESTGRGAPAYAPHAVREGHVQSAFHPGAILVYNVLGLSESAA